MVGLEDLAVDFSLQVGQVFVLHVVFALFGHLGGLVLGRSLVGLRSLVRLVILCALVVLGAPALEVLVGSVVVVLLEVLVLVSLWARP